MAKKKKFDVGEYAKELGLKVRIIQQGKDPLEDQLYKAYKKRYRKV